MNENTITPFDPVKPLVTVQEAISQWQTFEDLKQSLLVSDDYAIIQSKPYVKKSGFRKIAVFFGLSDEINHEERHDREDGSFYWRIKVKAIAPNNRTSIGVGICDSTERRFNHVEHDVYATAHTRAKNRAISDMVAGGIVSAEEMQTHNPTVKPRKKVEAIVGEPEPTPARNEPDNDEEHIIKTLHINDIQTHDLMIFKYDEAVIVKPREAHPDGSWSKINGVLERMKAKWRPVTKQWEVPIQ